MELRIPFSSSLPGIEALTLLGGEFLKSARPPPGTPVRGSRDEGSPAPFRIQIRGSDLIPFYWGGLRSGWNWDVTVLAGNQICDVKTQIRGEEERNRMRGIVVTTSRNGNLVEYSMMAMIRLGQVRG
jgi:hypothetical protein